jgi:hypothetical protein
MKVIKNPKDLTEGAQVLVDGIPAVVTSQDGSGRLLFFSPGSPKPKEVLGRWMVGEWAGCFLKERSYGKWSKDGTQLFGYSACALGGTLPDADKYSYREQGGRLPRLIAPEDACFAGRVVLNENPATHIDLKAWENAFHQAYSES